MSNQVGEKPPKSKVARWLELTSLGVICTFGGLFVYHYTQASAQSSPTERKVDPTPIVINTVVSEDAKRQIMANLPSKSKEKTLDVKPISLKDDETEELTIDDASTQLLPEESAVVAETKTPDSKSVAPVVPVKPTNPIEVISDPKQFASDQKKNNQKQKKPSIVAILQEKHRKQKEQKEKQQKQKPERISISVAKRPQQTQTKKPTTSQKAATANTKVTIQAKTKPATTTKPKTTTPKPATTTKPITTTPKPSTTTPKTNTSKPATTTKPKTTTPKKPAKKKAPYAIKKEFPGRSYFKSGANNKYVTQLGYMLVAAGYGKYYKVGPGPQWTSADKNACRAFQKKQGWTGSDADGYPGPETWNRLYKKYYTKYSH